MIFPPQNQLRSVVSHNSFNPDHSFSTRHLGLYPSAFFLLFLRENTHETTRLSLWRSIDGGPSGSLAEISALSLDSRKRITR